MLILTTIVFFLALLISVFTLKEFIVNSITKNSQELVNTVMTTMYYLIVILWTIFFYLLNN